MYERDKPVVAITSLSFSSLGMICTFSFFGCAIVGVGALQIFGGFAPSQVGEEDSPGGEIPI